MMFFAPLFKTLASVIPWDSPHWIGLLTGETALKIFLVMVIYALVIFFSSYLLQFSDSRSLLVALIMAALCLYEVSSGSPLAIGAYQTLYPASSRERIEALRKQIEDIEDRLPSPTNSPKNEAERQAFEALSTGLEKEKAQAATDFFADSKNAASAKGQTPKSNTRKIGGTP